MALRVVDHEDPRWHAAYAGRGRENGAATYSREIVAFQVPVWAELLAGLEVTVSTCPLLTGRDLTGDVAVQYLHEYRYSDPLARPAAVAAHLSARFDRVVFVTAYAALAAQMRGAGMDVIHLPMSIDVAAVAAHRRPAPLRARRRAAYYGNVTGPKRDTYREVRSTLIRAGWFVEHVQGRQQLAFRRLCGFGYGIGVGRCALEMSALGLRVMLAGAHFGGLVMTAADAAVQAEANLNGRVVTYDRDIAACAAAWPGARLIDPLDARAAAALLADRAGAALAPAAAVGR